MPPRLSGALPRASTCAAAAACSSTGPAPPGPQPRHAARHMARPDTPPAMRRPRAGPGAGAANASPQQLRAVPAPTSRAPNAAENGWPVTALLPKALPSTRNSRNNIRILSLTCGGAMGFEPQTSCMPCTLRPSPHVAERGPAWSSPAASVAVCGWRRLAPLHVGSRLGSQNSLAPLMFEDSATPPCGADLIAWPQTIGSAGDRAIQVRLPGGSDGDEVSVDPAASASARRSAGISEVRMSFPSPSRHAAVASTASGWPLRASSIPAGRPRASSTAVTSVRQAAGPRAPAGQCHFARPGRPLPRCSPPGQPLPLDQSHDITIAALYRDERPGSQHQHQAASPPGLGLCSLRATAHDDARPWAQRAASRISSSVTLSSGDLAGLKDVDGLGELPGAPGAAAELAQDVPGLELGIGALAGSAQFGM